MEELETRIVAREPRELDYSSEQLQLMKNQLAPGSTDGEFAMLIEIAKAKRLDPFKNQIHFVPRDGKWATQTSIDGFRSIAEDTGLYDGQDEPTFEYDQTTKQLKVARLHVYRKDISRAFVGVAYFDEYVQYTKEKKITKMWETKPHIMLAKCAEAIALRKAFPQQLAGIYSAEEMDRPEGAERMLGSSPAAPIAIDHRKQEEWTGKIGACQSLTEVDVLGAEMGKAGIGKVERNELAQIFLAKRKQLLIKEIAPESTREPGSDDE